MKIEIGTLINGKKNDSGIDLIPNIIILWDKYRFNIVIVVFCFYLGFKFKRKTLK
jgi:hypothetical protein